MLTDAEEGRHKLQNPGALQGQSLFGGVVILMIKRKHTLQENCHSTSSCEQNQSETKLKASPLSRRQLSHRHPDNDTIVCGR